MLLDPVDLKPCPCCDGGGAPCVNIVDERPSDLPFIRIYCMLCGTGTEKCYKTTEQNWEEVKQIAVDKWSSGNVTVGAEVGLFEILEPDGDEITQDGV